MRELSLHILDIIENSIRAAATVIFVTIDVDSDADSLRILLEDNGRGLAVPADVAANPFFTTKSGKKVGLGLSLFGAAAEQAGGKLQISQSSLGGAAVEAVMKLGHLDRAPMGDLAGTIFGVIATNPQLDLRLRVRAGGREFSLSSSQAAGAAGGEQEKTLAGARKFLDLARDAQAMLGGV